MGLEATGDTVLVPCRGCQRDVILPAGKVRATMRAGRQVVTFCSRRCERRTLAREGAKAQEANLARHLDAGSDPQRRTRP
jgi:hypothetical protein